MIKIKPILIHCWAIPNSNTYCAIPNPNTLLRYTLFFTFLNNSQKLIQCWAIPSPNRLLSYSLSCYIVEQFPISKHTEPYTILTHCWGIPYHITFLSNSEIIIHCRALPNPNTWLWWSLSYYIAEQFPIPIHTELYPILTHCWGIPYLFTFLNNSQILIRCWAIPDPNSLLRYTLSFYNPKQLPSTNILLSYTQA